MEALDTWVHFHIRCDVVKDAGETEAIAYFARSHGDILAVKFMYNGSEGTRRLKLSDRVPLTRLCGPWYIRQENDPWKTVARIHSYH